MKEYNFKHYVTQAMVDSFIKSTRDHNPIHDATLVEKPIVPGFELEAIAEQYANKALAKEGFNKQRDLSLASIVTKFNKKLYSESQLDINIRNNFPSNVEVSMFDEDEELILTSKFNYAVSKKEQPNSPHGNNIATYPLVAEDLERFYTGTGFTATKDVPFMFVPSMTSEALLDNVEIPKGLSPVYVKHGITIYKPSKMDGEVNLSLDSIKRRGDSYVMTDVSATINNEPVSKVNSSIFLMENP